MANNHQYLELDKEKDEEKKKKKGFKCTFCKIFFFFNLILIELIIIGFIIIAVIYGPTIYYTLQGLKTGETLITKLAKDFKTGIIMEAKTKDKSEGMTKCITQAITQCIKNKFADNQIISEILEKVPF